jgi:nucleotidyltransferase/DNA polymerase involved in DNA repair|tara:strand:+ start:10573 stop:10806 length:234 start_codon:yes stop_codon:yes gene_type:complete
MIYNRDNMKTSFEKYVDGCVKVLEKHTESLGISTVQELWKDIENAPAFTGKLWLEDILDKQYKEKVDPETEMNFVYD